MVRAYGVLTTVLVAVFFSPLTEPREASNCACPKEGRWKAQNLEGYMNCKGPFNIKRKLKPVKDEGTIWVLEKDCSSVFGEASKKKDEDSLMGRVDDGCGFEGTIEGEEEGVDMVIDITWTLENDEFIKGEMSSETSQMGITCEYYRPFEISFHEALSEQEYVKLKPKMEKKLEEVRKRKAKMAQ
jgi:hypothetical protein